LKLKHIFLSLTSTEDVENPHNLERVRILGRGNGGIVYKSFHYKSYSYYALKVPSVAHNFDLTSAHDSYLNSFLANVARQVVKGLKYLHSKKIVHRNIKPSNILISKNLKRIKIANFAVSKFVSSTIDPYCNSFVGTHAYMSLERFDLDNCGGSYNGYPDICGA
ncbi:hypothetical protein SUGI_0443990, partial [Cryptomeria japonica]